MPDISDLRAAVRSEGGASRRLFLSYGAALAAIPYIAARSEASARKVAFASNPFALGVASGDPEPDGVVLWTKLAPKPLDPDGGMPPEAVEVGWEIAEDEAFTKVVDSGKVAADPKWGHSVHVELTSLKPDRWYYYRFHAGDAVSPVGRTRTAPAADAVPENMRFAFASCQHFEAGLFTAYAHMLKDEPDVVFHLGDYIYEGAGSALKRPRRHLGGKIKTLSDYRVRHALYRSDPDLMAMHARCPWVVTWDDHEFENNYATLTSSLKETDPAEFLRRRAFAYQAYYEMMPLRKTSVPVGPDLKLYRTVSFGRLAKFQVLDTRQYRTDQPNGDGRKPLNEAALDPKNTILGPKQADWLRGELAKPGATWNVLAQQVMMGMVDLEPGEKKLYSMDQWPGYAAERIKLMQFIADKKVSNPVVLTGDIHSNWVNDLRVDDRKPETAVVATEFVGTSISSGGDGTDRPAKLEDLMAENPGLRFHNRQRGYVRCDLTPKEWTSSYVVMDQVTKPGGNASVRAKFVVEAGKPGAKPA